MTRYLKHERIVTFCLLHRCEGVAYGFMEELERVIANFFAGTKSSISGLTFSSKETTTKLWKLRGELVYLCKKIFLPHMLFLSRKIKQTEE